MIKSLKPTQQTFFNKKVYGFDIETYDNNKKFLMCSIYSDDFQKFYYSTEDFVSDLKTNPIFKDSFIFATNLAFDFFGVFFTHKDKKEFYTLFQGSGLLFAKTYFYKGEFLSQGRLKTMSLKSLTFIDSLNFAKMSVEKMGKILGLPKLTTPSFIGQKPKNHEEWEEMKLYNMRDSQVTYMFVKFLIKSFETLGATFKNTLASTSMTLFKNHYLDKEYYLPEEWVLLEQLESYYGGRTEAFSRGYFKDYLYYDFNSLYPSVMRDFDFPDPNSLRITRRNNEEIIFKYHGCSHVKIYVPEMKFPPLPYKQENGRVIFPCGKIEGWYTHEELRYAVSLGCTIVEVIKSHYYLEMCRPFERFMNDLYNLRLRFKEEKNPMEYVVKITMNSLYGKFSQRFLEKDNWVHESFLQYEEKIEENQVEIKNGYARIVKDTAPAVFCIPIWASYVTTYGRIKLHKALVKGDAIYCDTDSIITKETFPESNKLGELKLEMPVDECIIVRPKFYALKSNNDEYVKIKGLGRRLKYIEFTGTFLNMLHSYKHLKILSNTPLNSLKIVKMIEIHEQLKIQGFMTTPALDYDKFTKFKEAIRRDFIPNEIIAVHKEFSLNDEKRIWEKENFSLLKQESKPLRINCF